MTGPQRIYLDHAATSWPKPAAVLQAVDDFSRQCGAAPGRGAYRSAIQAGKAVEGLRSSLARLIRAESTECVTLHASGTMAINAGIHGLVRPGDHVVTTAAEHNSVLRPLHHLQHRQQVALTIVPCDEAGRVDSETLLQAVRDETRLVAVTHASNVTGSLQPIDEIGRSLRGHPAAFLCDAAQTFGYLSIDVREMNVDLLAAPGHKGGCGPLGTGFLYVARHLHDDLVPMIQGGTGTDSHSLEMPQRMPSKLEAGVLNSPAYAGWNAGLRQAQEASSQDAPSRITLTRKGLLERLSSLEGVRLIGRPEDAGLPIASLLFDGLSVTEAASILDVEFGIEARAGLHCAALIHSFLGTADEGTLRISAGRTTTEAELDQVTDAVRRIAESLR